MEIHFKITGILLMVLDLLHFCFLTMHFRKLKDHLMKYISKIIACKNYSN
jgi:hypothetical protein